MSEENTPAAGQPRACPIAASLQVLGERWTLLAIRELNYGVHRFEAIVRNTGATRDLLALRLRKLESAGIIEKRQYSEHPVRFEPFDRPGDPRHLSGFPAVPSPPVRRTGPDWRGRRPLAG